jgi:hypothetical protein
MFRADLENDSGNAQPGKPQSEIRCFQGRDGLVAPFDFAQDRL